MRDKKGAMVGGGYCLVLVLVAALVWRSTSDIPRTGGAPYDFVLSNNNDDDNNNNKEKLSSSSLSFDLATQQSYGYLRDVVSDASWQRFQQRALQAPQYKFSNFPERAFGVPLRWMIKNLQPILTCPAAERWGIDQDEQAFWVCDPYRLEEDPSSKDNLNDDTQDTKASRSCLIYVIGFTGAWERELIQRLPACEVHVMDPRFTSAKTIPWQPQEEQQEAQVHWHSWGLKSSHEQLPPETQSKIQKQFPGATWLTLREMQQRLGHCDDSRHRHVDILKLDCGGVAAWSSYQDWIALNATQILWRLQGGLPSPRDANAVHPSGPLKFSLVFAALQDAGYAMFAKQYYAQRGPTLELGYLRLHGDFWKRAKEYANQPY